MYKTRPAMTCGCQCGSVRYARFAPAEFLPRSQVPETGWWSFRRPGKSSAGEFHMDARRACQLSQFNCRRTSLGRCLRHAIDISLSGRRCGRGDYRQPGFTVIRTGDKKISALNRSYPGSDLSRQANCRWHLR